MPHAGNGGLEAQADQDLRCPLSESLNNIDHNSTNKESTDKTARMIMAF